MAVNYGLGNKFGKGQGKTGTFGEKGAEQLNTAGVTDVADFEEWAKAEGHGGRKADWNNAITTYLARPPAEEAPAEEAPAPAPQSPQADNISNVGGQGAATTQIGVGQTAAGGNMAQDGAGMLRDLLGAMNNRGGFTYDRFNDYADEVFNYLTQGMQANVDPEFLNRLQGMRDERDGMIDFEFSNQGQTGGQLAKGANDWNAFFANELGMGGAGNSANVNAQSELQARREAMKNQAKLSSLQDFQNQFLGERGRISDFAGDAAKTTTGLTDVFGDFSLGTSGIGSQAGAQIGNLGIGLGNTGAQNIGTGLSAQDAAIGRGLESTGLEAEIKQAQAVLQNQFMQQILNNLFQNKNIKWNKEMMDMILPYLMQPAQGTGGFLGM